MTGRQDERARSQSGPPEVEGRRLGIAWSGRPPAPDVELDADRYVIEEEVGHGGMGTVYRARQVGLDRFVALKILRTPPHPDDKAAFEDRFRREAETLAQFDHPNIVKLFDFGSARSGHLFLAMEFVDGPRFTDLLRNGPLPVQDVLPLILQVCSGLRYAHQFGAVHRDLKPGNLLVRGRDGRRQVKIVDFGLVKLVDDEQTFTREGVILGSPHCMAPEQVRGERVDHRTDIYALGVLMFRCLGGAYPFPRGTPAATLMGHLNDPVPRLSEAAPDLALPDGLEAIIERCMQKDPADRFQSVDGVVERLGPIADLFRRESTSGTLSSPNTSASVASRPSRATAPPTRRRTLLVPAAASTLGVALVGAVLALNWPGPRPPSDVPAAAAPPDLSVLVPAGPPADPEPTDALEAPPANEDPSPDLQVVPAEEIVVEPLPADASADPPEEETPPPAGYLGLPDDL